MASAERIAGWMRQQVQAAGARGFAIGLSGGVDSALVARLAQLAVPGGALGVIMPCHGDPQDEHDARLVAEHFSLPVVRIDVAKAYDALIAAAQPPLDRVVPPAHDQPPLDPLRGHVPAANVKPRIRMTALYYLANRLNYLVAGTGNRSELAVGYYTKWGDGGVDVLPLGRLVKRQVRELAQELGVPQAVIDRPPSAGLWAGQRDEDEMGFTYADLERYLADGAAGVAPALAMKIERLVRASEHKRVMPPMPDLA